MKIVVFGANGKVGSLVVDLALKKNIQVVAFVYGDADFKSDKNLKIVKGSVYDADEVDQAIDGVDSVVSALGSWGTPNKDILTVGMENIIPAMQKRGIKRIVSLTGADASIEGESSSLSKFLLGLVAKKILNDGEEHLRLLSNSNLDWTVVRSPVMNEKGDANAFELTETKPASWATINRHSVAKAMVELIDDKNFLKQAPFILRSKK